MQVEEAEVDIMSWTIKVEMSNMDCPDRIVPENLKVYVVYCGYKGVKKNTLCSSSCPRMVD